MDIKRDSYLEKLISREKNGLIKIVTGVRRCGKSYLLFNIFHRYLLEKGIDASHIIEIALDDRSNITLRNPDNMLAYVKDKIVDGLDYYIILDEVQLLDEFEDVLNSFLHIKNADVYVTGSNSKFLSSDVITEFRGRGDEIRIYPLNFREYLSAYDGSPEDAWDDYMMYGGLPFILNRQTPEEKEDYLIHLFQTVYFSDIIDRHHVRNKEELDELINILASSVGSLTNSLKLAKTFYSVKHKKISSATLKKYADYLEDAFLISKATRYDVKGKKYINSLVKYYFEDIGIRNAKLGFRQVEENHLMENIIYNELRNRGYRVDVGIVESYGKNKVQKTIRKQYEIDFVASRGSQRYYLQSAYAMNTQEKIQQEQNSLMHVNDSFKKIIIVKDHTKPRRDEHGFVTMGILNFLSDEHSLEF